MACISNSKFSICVNGERYGYFKMGRGLRQEDPISPYILTIVMEMLNLIVKDEIRKEKSFKFYFGCKQLRITHLCFANDLIMLYHGGVESVQTIKKHWISLVQSHAFIQTLGSVLCSVEAWIVRQKNAISNILPFKEGKLLVKYLGINDIEKLFKRFLWNIGRAAKGRGGKLYEIQNWE
nr:RNA-directed DNA polymerase, eukaryota, reverse transcriptase zinc-binding domain protein [Tanacetum cinerariifolium]